MSGPSLDYLATQIQICQALIGEIERCYPNIRSWGHDMSSQIGEDWRRLTDLKTSLETLKDSFQSVVGLGNGGRHER